VVERVWEGKQAMSDETDKHSLSIYLWCESCRYVWDEELGWVRQEDEDEVALAQKTVE
jgi:hypothetical protein